MGQLTTCLPRFSPSVSCPPLSLARPSTPLVSPPLPAQTTLTAASPLQVMPELSLPTPLESPLPSAPTIPTALVLHLFPLAMSTLLDSPLESLELFALTTLTASNPGLPFHFLPFFLHLLDGTQFFTSFTDASHRHER